MNERVREIVGEMGGKEAAARLCNVTTEAVKKWSQNGIPTKHWPVIVESSSGGISYERLAQANAPKEMRAAS